VFVLGLLLLAAGGAVAVAVALHNTDAATLTAFGSSFHTTLAGVFGVGAACGIAVVLGLAMMAASANRRRARRRTMRGQLRDVRTENERLADENAELRAAMVDNQTLDSGDPYPVEGDTGSRHSLRG